MLVAGAVSIGLHVGALAAVRQLPQPEPKPASVPIELRFQTSPPPVQRPPEPPAPEPPPPTEAKRRRTRRPRRERPPTAPPAPTPAGPEATSDPTPPSEETAPTAEQLEAAGVLRPSAPPSADSVDGIVFGLPGRRAREAAARRGKARGKAVGDAEAKIIALAGDTGKFDLKPTSDGGFRWEDANFAARISPDGQVYIEDKSRVKGVQMLEAGPTLVFDVTEMAMDESGLDVGAYEKRAFFEATRELRSALKDLARREDLRASVKRLEPRLERIWRSARPAKARRRLLFQLWDECAEEGRPEAVRVAAMARSLIEDFVHEHLPPGSRDAYPASELAELNRGRRSKARFQPR